MFGQFPFLFTKSIQINRHGFQSGMPSIAHLRRRGATACGERFSAEIDRENMKQNHLFCFIARKFALPPQAGKINQGRPLCRAASDVLYQFSHSNPQGFGHTPQRTQRNVFLPSFHPAHIVWVKISLFRQPLL